MIRLNHNHNVLAHSGFPALCRDIFQDHSVIRCTEFNPDTKWAIMSESGHVLPEAERLWWGEMKHGELMILILPENWTVTILRTQELVSTDDFKGILSEMETNQIVSVAYEPPAEQKYNGILSVSNWNKWVDEIGEEYSESFTREPDKEMTPLEAFDELIKMADKWWFSRTNEQAQEAKQIVPYISGSLLGTVDRLRLFIGSVEYEGVTDNLIEKRPEHIQEIRDDLDAVKNERIKAEYNSMFFNRMKYTPTSHQRELLGQKILKWAQEL